MTPHPTKETYISIVRHLSEQKIGYHIFPTEEEKTPRVAIRGYSKAFRKRTPNWNGKN